MGCCVAVRIIDVLNEKYKNVKGSELYMCFLTPLINGYVFLLLITVFFYVSNFEL